MWELIEANKRKSILLFISMGVCLVLLGYFIGAFYSPAGGIAGLIIALSIWFFLSLISYFAGDSIILSVSKAKEVSHDVHPRLFNVVEEMKIAANLPAMPKIYIIDDPAPNAFATGTKPEKSAIAVTAGLLSGLNRDELQGVVAHEMSHIANRDALFMTFAGILLGSIVIIAEIFLRSIWFSSGSSRRYRSGGKGQGQIQLVIIVVAIILAILAPILARILYFAISRRREYLSDACAVRLTRYPEGLASALEKISSVSLDLASANKATAPMYIVNPLKKKGMKLSDLTSTHPPISRRIKILRGMMRGVNYSNYQEAFSGVLGKTSHIIPPSGLRDTGVIPIRKASLEKPRERGTKEKARDISDLMRAVNKYAFLICACGLKIKVPPDFKKPKLSCPRCKREIEVPLAGMAAVTAAAAVALAKKGKIKGEQTSPQTYIKKGKGWETFSCSCGRPIQLSPTFQSPRVVCSACGRDVEIVPPARNF